MLYQLVVLTGAIVPEGLSLILVEVIKLTIAE